MVCPPRPPGIFGTRQPASAEALLCALHTYDEASKPNTNMLLAFDAFLMLLPYATAEGAVFAFTYLLQHLSYMMPAP
eukprot:9470769-Karenia_brevis.AAC.1